MNTQNTIRRILGFLAAVLWLMLHSAIATAALKPAGAIVPVANSSFETPNLLPDTWTFTVPGWQPLSDSTVAGVWRPSNQQFSNQLFSHHRLTYHRFSDHHFFEHEFADHHCFDHYFSEHRFFDRHFSEHEFSADRFSNHAGVDGKNMLYIDHGGVGQQLPVNLRSRTDYSLSTRWGQRFDVMLGAVALQFVAGGKVLATCAPPYGPGAGSFAVITLVYHSGTANPASGQPLAIRIVKRDDVAIPSPIVNSGWGTQVDIEDVQVTSAAHSVAPAAHGSECTTSIVEATQPQQGGNLADPANSAAVAEVALMNSSFEDPVTVTAGTWTDYVPGWAPAEGSEAGVWLPLPGQFSADAPIQESKILYINRGSVSQELPIRLQAMADYSFSVGWGHRLDMMSGALALQLVADGQVLASCAPPTGPDPGQFATVTVAYHSDGSSHAVGQPLTIQIVKLPQDIPTVVVNPNWGTQVDIYDAQVTFTDRTGAPSSAITNAQECTLTTFQ